MEGSNENGRIIPFQLPASYRQAIMLDEGEDEMDNLADDERLELVLDQIECSLMTPGEVARTVLILLASIGINLQLAETDPQAAIRDYNARNCQTVISHLSRVINRE
jgi:hypothetical protein